MELINDDMLGEIFLYSVMKTEVGIILRQTIRTYHYQNIRSIMLVNKRWNCCLKKAMRWWLFNGIMNFNIFDKEGNYDLSSLIYEISSNYWHFSKSKQPEEIKLDLKLSSKDHWIIPRINKMAKFLNWTYYIIGEEYACIDSTWQEETRSWLVLTIAKN
jgi:hypothetical protein